MNLLLTFLLTIPLSLEQQHEALCDSAQNTVAKFCVPTRQHQCPEYAYACMTKEFLQQSEHLATLRRLIALEKQEFCPAPAKLLTTITAIQQLADKQAIYREQNLNKTTFNHTLMRKLDCHCREKHCKQPSTKHNFKKRGTLKQPQWKN